MTEQEWLGCEDARPMLYFLRGKAGDRKLRLFACACCRHVVWGLLEDETSRQAVAIAEQFADKQADSTSLEAARASALAAMEAKGHGTKARKAALVAEATTRTDWLPEVVALHAASSAYVFGEQWVIGVRRILKSVRDRQKEARAKIRSAKQHVAKLLHCIIGNPFRPVALNPAWLAWNDGTVPKLAQAIYGDRAFDRLPILADALEEAGCANADLLTHCRGPGPHVRGCWVVDLILEKQ